MAEAAVIIGTHLLKACDKLIVDPTQQKKFILKYLYLFDLHLSKSNGKGGELPRD